MHSSLCIIYTAEQGNKGLKQKRFPHLSEESVSNDMYKNE